MFIHHIHTHTLATNMEDLSKLMVTLLGRGAFRTEHLTINETIFEVGCHDLYQGKSTLQSVWFISPSDVELLKH